MKTFRSVDKALAAGDGETPPAKVFRRTDARPSVEERFEYYWSGEGWHRALTEAKRLIENGKTFEHAASNVGWTENELRIAIRRGRPPKAKAVAPEQAARDRPKRTVKQRVEGLKDVDRQVMARARRLYEIEIMTVREVARVISQPYEKTYLILKKAGTKFRRPGRLKKAEAKVRRPG